MLLQIDGWYGAGKSVLLGLLDGHPDIAPSPIHDATHMFGLLEKAINSCNYHDIEEIRRLLGHTQYFLLEKHGRLGYGYVSFGAGIELQSVFKFNFYEFDKAWVTELLQLETWSPEQVVDIIYKNYNLYLTGKNSWKYHVSMSWPIQEYQERFIQNFKYAKSIFVERPIDHIVAVRSGRKKIENSNDSFFAPGFDKLIKEGEIKKIMDYNSFIYQMIQKHPDRIMKVSFNSLIHDRKKTMTKVSEFLEVPFHESMLKWTFLGDETKHNGKSYVDEVNDKPELILSMDQRKTIEKEIRKVNQKLKMPTIPALIQKTGTVFHMLAKKLEK